MSRQPRIVIPDYPHHVTHRGNRKADIFLDDIDRQVYIKKLITQCLEWSVKIWAWCLMSNHVLCGALHNTHNAESILMQTEGGWKQAIVLSFQLEPSAS
jgi:REP element-mobilizing transposase RayT